MLQPDDLDAAIHANKPTLLIHGTDLSATVDALCALLARHGRFYDSSGQLIRLIASSPGALPRIVAVDKHWIAKETHRLCQPVRLTKKGDEVPVPLPVRVAEMYLALRVWDVPPLAGMTTAPLLADDGAIQQQSGYDAERQIWCESSVTLSVPERPTKHEAEQALYTLREAFATFPFARAPMLRRGDLDYLDLSVAPGLAESSFLAALLTACCRASLWLAPGTAITAAKLSGAGSGKGFLARAICAVAFGWAPGLFPKGHNREELDKRLVSELIAANPAIILDNMNADTLNSDTLATALTERPSRLRVLGLSEMREINCASFVAVTGNGLTLGEDLVRRFLLVELDAKCENPEERPFPPGFVDGIRARRPELLSAALTVWRWGRQSAGSLIRGQSLGSFEMWCQWVRDPLLSLGCADPVARIRAAKATDPARQSLADLLLVWWSCHQDQAVTAAQLGEEVLARINPHNKDRQFVASYLAGLDGTRAAGFVLTRNKPRGKWSPSTYALRRTEAQQQRTEAQQEPIAPAPAPQPAAADGRGRKFVYRKRDPLELAARLRRYDVN